MRNEVKVGRLPNGFRFYSQYDASNTAHLAGIGVKRGSIHDPSNASGLFHLIEHCLSRECLKYSSHEVDRAIERYGGGPGGLNTNIRIDRVSTFYGFDSLFRKESMLAGLDVMANLLRDKIFTKNGLQIEAPAIHNEYYTYGRDLIPNLIDDLMHQTMYELNPARKKIDCEVEDLRRLAAKPNQIQRTIGRHYIAGNMFMIVLGPKHEKVRELAKEYFGELPSKEAPPLKYDHSDDLPVLNSTKRAQIVKPGIGQYHYGIGFPTEACLSKDAEALDVLSRIWAWRLRDRLREGNCHFDKGVYRALSYTERSFVHGMIYAWYASICRDFAKAGEGVVIEEANRLKQDLVNEGDLDAVIGNLDEEEYLQTFRNSPDMLCEMIIEAVCNGDEELKGLHTYRNRLYRVTRKRLREVANKYFTDNYIRVVVGPEPVDE